MKTHSLSKETITERSDRMLLETRLVMATILPFLVLAFLILYLRPAESGERFAWNIQPLLTAMYIGAGYLGGAYLFARIIFSRSWHQVGIIFLPVTSFAVTMLLTTILHRDRFDLQHLPAQLWVILYVVTPFLIGGVWLRNRRQDPGVPAPGDKRIPQISRVIMGLLGLALTALALVGFLMPAWLIALWPWTLTPLTARVLSGWHLLLGLGGLAISREVRWNAWKIPLQTILLWHLLLLVAIATRTEDFRSSSFALLYTAVVLIILGGVIGLYVYMMRRGTQES